MSEDNSPGITGDLKKLDIKSVSMQIEATTKELIKITFHSRVDLSCDRIVPEDVQDQFIRTLDLRRP